MQHTYTPYSYAYTNTFSNNSSTCTNKLYNRTYECTHAHTQLDNVYRYISTFTCKRGRLRRLNCGARSGQRPVASTWNPLACSKMFDASWKRTRLWIKSVLTTDVEVPLHGFPASRPEPQSKKNSPRIIAVRSIAFSFMRSKAPVEPTLVTSESISLTCRHTVPTATSESDFCRRRAAPSTKEILSCLSSRLGRACTCDELLLLLAPMDPSGPKAAPMGTFRLFGLRDLRLHFGDKG